MPEDLKTPADQVDRSDAPLLGKMGKLETRLARSDAEVRDAQALRYKVFHQEMGAVASKTNALSKRDNDRFDAYCDHLLVIDTGNASPRIVGTYRLMLEKHALAASGFYSQGEFELSALIAANKGKRFLELGRSCILPDYRSKRTMELLWHGTWAYAVNNRIDVMFGCASFQGTDPDALKLPLGWLAEHVALSTNEDCGAKAGNGVDLLAMRDADADPRKALAAMPPLLKGYLRLGAKVASTAVIDQEFGTTDVLVVLKVSDINPRYIAHYGADASRYAA